MIILVETASGLPPTATSCAQVREQYGHTSVFSAYAPSGQANVLWAGMPGYTSLNVFLDSDQVITHKVSTDIQTQIEAQIGVALDH